VKWSVPKGSWALVTGASSGIGAALAEALAARGVPLVLAARSKEALESLAARLRADEGIEAIAHPCDLTVEGAAAGLIEATEGSGRPLGLLVNDAGFGWNGAFSEQPLPRVLDMLRLNVVAATELMRRALPAMRARRAGAVLNVASTAAFVPGPFFAEYSATKSYLLSLSMALHEELRPEGVLVTALCPGFTRTGFSAVAGMRGAEGTGFPEMSPGDVAAAGLRALDRGVSYAVTHPLDRVWIAAGRLAPRTWPPKIAARLFRRTKLS
jgi:hypothetical protein